MSQQLAMFRKKGVPRALEADFAAFWAAYPRRRPNPRALAEAAFTRAVAGGAAPAALVVAAAAYAAECAAKAVGEDFVVHAATFLRQRRWEDYLLGSGGTPPAAAVVDHPLWARCAPHMDAATFRAWLGRCQVMGDTSEELLLSAPSGFVAKRIEQDFSALLKRVCGCLVITIDVGM